MKVDSTQADKFALQKRRLIEQNQKELDEINKFYRDSIAKVKKQGSAEIQEESAKINLSKTELDLKKQKELTDSLKQLREEKNKIEAEKQKLEEFGKQQIDAVLADNQTKLADKRNQFISNLEQETYDLESLSSDISTDAKADIRGLINDFNSEKEDQRIVQEKVINREREDFKTEQLQNQMKYNQTIAETKKQFQNEFAEKQNLYKFKIEQLSKEHTKKLEDLRKLHEQELQSQQDNFLRKYNHNLNTQTQQLKNLESNIHIERNKIIADQNKMKETVYERVQDKFYQPNIIEPKLDLKDDHYLVKIPVAEWEQGQVILSTHGRRIKVSLTRVSDARFTLPDGSLNKSNRAESIVKEFEVPQLLSRQGITREYDGRQLVYKVPLAV